jgi:hypothetical protein
MRRASGNGKGMAGTPLKFELFPFLSILLCFMGTIAFLQLLLSATMSPKVTLSVAVSRGSMTAFQLYCKEEGVLAIPDLDGLAELARHLSLEDREQLQPVIERRERDLASVRAAPPEQRFVTVDKKRLKQWLDDIALINRLSRQSGQRRQEFILFGIYPGGGRVYHTVRRMLGGEDADAAHVGIAVGAELLQPNWEVPL